MPCDYSKYPPNWFTEIRPAVLLRAENRCETCKVENYALILRGLWLGKPCYQDEHGMVWSAEDGRKLGGTYWGDIDKAAQRITKVILTIAHLDNDKENWEVKLERLKALCQRCHLLLDLPHHMERAKETRESKKQQIKLNI